MPLNALVLVTSDPRTSARPAEAVRIAAGVGAWKRIAVSLYLREAAVLALSEFTDELADEDNFNRYLPIIGEFGRPVYVQKDAPLLAELGAATLKYVAIDDAQLADLAARHHYVLRF